MGLDVGRCAVRRRKVLAQPRRDEQKTGGHVLIPARIKDVIAWTCKVMVRTQWTQPGYLAWTEGDMMTAGTDCRVRYPVKHRIITWPWMAGRKDQWVKHVSLESFRLR